MMSRLMRNLRPSQVKLHAQNLREFRADLRACDRFCDTLTAHAANPLDVRVVQRLAISIGLDLADDGVLGPLTVRFLRMFQSTYALGPWKTAPLAVTGVPDGPTLMAVTHCRANGLRVTENFRYSEYMTKNPDRTVTRSNPVLALNRRLSDGMQAIRDHYGVPVSIISGFRDSFWNSIVGGASESQHLLGKAADFRLAGEKPTEPVCRRWFNGIGTARITGRVVHVDVRDLFARWFYPGV